MGWEARQNSNNTQPLCWHCLDARECVNGAVFGLSLAWERAGKGGAPPNAGKENGLVSL